MITHVKSGKMKQIEENNVVGICGDWFTAHGIGENLGHILCIHLTDGILYSHGTKYNIDFTDI